MLGERMVNLFCFSSLTTTAKMVFWGGGRGFCGGAIGKEYVYGCEMVKPYCLQIAW